MKIVGHLELDEPIFIEGKAVFLPSFQKGLDLSKETLKTYLIDAQLYTNKGLYEIFTNYFDINKILDHLGFYNSDTLSEIEKTEKFFYGLFKIDFINLDIDNIIDKNNDRASYYIPMKDIFTVDGNIRNPSEYYIICNITQLKYSNYFSVIPSNSSYPSLTYFINGSKINALEYKILVKPKKNIPEKVTTIKPFNLDSL